MMTFRTLSVVNQYENGRVVRVGKRIITNNKMHIKPEIKRIAAWMNEQIKIKRDKEKVMANKKRGIKFNDGSGVPFMSVLNFSGKEKVDPIDTILNYFAEKFGGDSNKARAELKKLDGPSVLKLLEAIKTNESTASIAFKKGNFEAYSMPKMKY